MCVFFLALHLVSLLFCCSTVVWRLTLDTDLYFDVAQGLNSNIRNWDVPLQLVVGKGWQMWRAVCYCHITQRTVCHVRSNLLISTELLLNSHFHCSIRILFVLMSPSQQVSTTASPLISICISCKKIPRMDGRVGGWLSSLLQNAGQRERERERTPKLKAWHMKLILDVCNTAIHHISHRKDGIKLGAFGCVSHNLLDAYTVVPS